MGRGENALGRVTFLTDVTFVTTQITVSREEVPLRCTNVTYVGKFAKIGFANGCANAQITEVCELVRIANYQHRAPAQRSAALESESESS